MDINLDGAFWCTQACAKLMLKNGGGSVVNIAYRYGSTEEIDNAVAFLCSPEASFINGQTIAVDGGFDAAGIGLPTMRKSRQSQLGESQSQPIVRRRLAKKSSD
jgi:hypothetical protein